LALAAAFTLAGCTTEPPPETPAPPPPAARPVSEVRARFARLNPDVLTGLVVAARPADRLVAVGDIPVADFKPGDVITFFGATDEAALGSGLVEEILKDTLHVRYPIPAEGHRAPTKGDIAVRFKR
jgi:hypothetical protein